MEKAGFFKAALKKTSLLLVLFLLIYLATFLFAYLETRTNCFPITVITVEEESVKQMIKSIKTCSFSVESEKMTFDSSIFNHYETPPVKDIFLFYVEIPFANWQMFSEIENVIPEANPFLLRIVRKYSSSKLKVFLLAYIMLFVSGLIILFRVAPSKKEPSYNYKKTAILTVFLYLLFSVPAFVVFNSGILLFAFFILITLLIAYISMLLILYRLIFAEEKR